MRLILLAFLVCCALCYASGDSDVPVEAESGYAFYYPLIMASNQRSKVCLEIDEKLLPGKVKVLFNNETCGEACESHAIDSGFSCWDIAAPNIQDSYHTSSKIAIVIATNDENVTFTGEEQVRVMEDKVKVFMETDKKVYKKGDTVKIRFLALDFDLKPFKDYKIPTVQIVSPYPSSATVKRWENISTDSGLAQIEFQLAPDTPEGFWRITGAGQYFAFEVKKYVLPRFQVTVEGPGELYQVVESVSYSVCGKYSYGRNVKGTALIVIKAHYRGETVNHSEVKELNGGCAKFEFFDVESALQNRSFWSLDITGTVTEDGTGQVESGSKYVYINRLSYSTKWVPGTRYIKPELPYTTKLIFSNVHMPLNSSPLRVCYENEWGRMDTTIACNNFTLDSDNAIELTVPPLKNATAIKRIHIKTSLDYYSGSTPTYNSLYLTVWHSGSENALKISEAQPNPKECGSTLSFIVLYNSGRFMEDENVEFKYMLTSRSEILSSGSVLHKPKKELLNLDNYPNVIGYEDYELDENSVDQFELKIELVNKVYTGSRLLVYYTYDNEVISDYIDFAVTKCGPNGVEAKWAESVLYPGEVGQLNIKTDTESLCSVTSVDKATTFLGSPDTITLDKIISNSHRHSHIRKLNCITPETNVSSYNGIYPSYYHSNLFDSYESFKDSDVGIISNMKFMSKICDVSSLTYPAMVHGEKGDSIGPVEIAAMVHGEKGDSIGPVEIENKIGSGVQDEPVDSDRIIQNSGPIAENLPAAVSDDRGSAVRSFFPETWLWDLVPVGDGEVTIERKLPDSITDWVGNVLCVSSNKGVGLSDGIEIKAFKPFFLDILLPYSIKRNKEILHLPIPIFNYLNHSLPIRVTLEPTDDIVLVDGEEKKSFSMCLAAEDSYTHKYRIKSTKIGYAKITVSADVDPSYVENCAPESVIRRRDVVQKSVLVEPEGYRGSLTKGALLCANDSSGPDNIDWPINLPENVVLDTVDGRVIINSDILGPMFQNLESILIVPTGCGEQTMATLSPNLYVLKYLEANNALTGNTKEKILKNLEIGYQRMLNYVHNDGSFSAFGGSDQSGSMFLTAFVIRTFKQMRNYIFIDDGVINKAVKWIVSHQLENGCFDSVHHVFHDMGLSSSKNQTTALTSYVLISVLETDIEIDQNVLSRAKECILSDSTLDKYALAVSSYALGLMNLTEDVQKRLDKLTELAENSNGSTWWSQSDKSNSANVEVSSYVLISLLQQDPTENLVTASSIIRYLQSKMTPRGGFFSTQDTVLGLDAISRYAILVNKNEPNVLISLVTNTESKELEITERDRTKTEVIPLTSYPNKVEAKISGSGCVSIQATVNYYLDKPLVADDLKLDITLKPAYQKFKCSVIEIKPCVSYTSSGSINMAIVEVTLLSGYAPDQASLYELTSSSTSGVKKFELIRNQVVFYLTQLGSNEVCLPFKIDENLIIENVANATVKLYDYYRPELSVSKSFTLDDCAANIAVEA